tara:strand:+ start:555 stop:1169 length:615 start_codon:yes stop_codon:yes gene_type:complete
MYKLFYAEGIASMGIRVLLEELRVPYELIKSTINMDEPRPSEQIEINPNGWIPVLIGDESIYEAAAITIYLCDKHSSVGLAPKAEENTRGLYLQTLVYFSNSVQNAFQLTYYPERFSHNTDGFESAMKRGISRLFETWKVVDDQIGKNAWVLGDKFSAVDIYLFMLTTWLNKSMGHPLISEFSNVERLAKKVKTRKTVKKVYGF